MGQEKKEGSMGEKNPKIVKFEGGILGFWLFKMIIYRLNGKKNILDKAREE